MRRYDEPIEVDRGAGGQWPGEFWWRGQRWRTGEVLEHWIETEAWWRLLATDQLDRPDQQAAGDLLEDREFWRVEARRSSGHHATDISGVFDLVFAWTTAQWRLVGCVD